MHLRDDYECLNCNTVFEYKKEYGEDYPEHPQCPSCGKTDTKRIITPRGLVIPDYMRSVNN